MIDRGVLCGALVSLYPSRRVVGEKLPKEGNEAFEST
jgi:hypothetical protein